MSTFKMKLGPALGIIAMLGACGGGDNTSTPVVTSPAGPIAGTPTPSPTSGTCSLRNRQLFVQAQMQEWYLFPETLPASLDPALYATVQDYIDALTATARAQGKDKNFTFITSIAEENAFFANGTTAAFGIRLSYDSPSARVFVVDAYEGAPALAAGIDRGSEILAIGTTAANLRDVSAIFAAEGAAGVSAALGPSDPGITRMLRVRDAAGTVAVKSVTKAEFEIPPVSPRFGVQVIQENGKKVGYVNLRTFIGSADTALRDAFARFRAENVTEVVIDLRYNGGGLVRIAETFGDLLGRNRSASDVFSFTTFRASKSSENSTRNFRAAAQSIAPTKLAFITTRGSASASELILNAMLPYLGGNVGMIGSDTFGKPVGQIGLDKAECDDRLRVVAFKTQNADRQGDYFNGLAEFVKSTCRAPDDITLQLGNPQEGSTRQALDFLNGASCTPIASGISAQSQRGSQPLNGAAEKQLLMPTNPDVYQRELPGSF